MYDKVNIEVASVACSFYLLTDNRFVLVYFKAKENPYAKVLRRGATSKGGVS